VAQQQTTYVWEPAVTFRFLCCCSNVKRVKKWCKKFGCVNW